MNVLIAGCGYLGCVLGSELIARGNRVWGLCRSESSIQKIQAAGLAPVRADMNHPQSLRDLPAVDAVVACQAPSKGESYLSAYLQGTENLIAALKPAANLRFVFVSSTSVYGPHTGGWVEADTPILTGPLDEDARVLRKAEEKVLTAPWKGMVVRLSGLYGPGRNRADAIRAGRFKPAKGPAYTNRIHRDDAAGAIIQVLVHGTPGQTYLASDDAPATQTEFYSWLCEKIGAPAPQDPSGPAVEDSAKAFADSKRCSNAKLKQLGWTPRYPSYREGYGALLA